MEMTKISGHAKTASFRHGVHPVEHKEHTDRLAIERIPFVDEYVLPLAQHIGARGWTLQVHLDGDRGPAAGGAPWDPERRFGPPRELGWAATFLASPYASYVTGHTMVVDGANWQRRAMLMPEFVPIREQLGRGPFSAD